MSLHVLCLDGADKDELIQFFQVPYYSNDEEIPKTLTINHYKFWTPISPPWAASQSEYYLVLWSEQDEPSDGDIRAEIVEQYGSLGTFDHTCAVCRKPFQSEFASQDYDPDGVGTKPICEPCDDKQIMKDNARD